MVVNCNFVFFVDCIYGIVWIYLVEFLFLWLDVLGFGFCFGWVFGIGLNLWWFCNVIIVEIIVNWVFFDRLLEIVLLVFVRLWLEKEMR